MVPHPGYSSTPNGATLEEFRSLLNLRLETLDAATALGRLDGPLPVQWRVGWRATLKVLGRDRDGSLCALITCTGPTLCEPYVRKVRLCKRKPLPVGLRIE
jgi:hypothetical protein